MRERQLSLNALSECEDNFETDGDEINFSAINCLFQSEVSLGMKQLETHFVFIILLCSFSTSTKDVPIKLYLEGMLTNCEESHTNS